MSPSVAQDIPTSDTTEAPAIPADVAPDIPAAYPGKRKRTLGLLGFLVFFTLVSVSGLAVWQTLEARGRSAELAVAPKLGTPYLARFDALQGELAAKEKQVRRLELDLAAAKGQAEIQAARLNAAAPPPSRSAPASAPKELSSFSGQCALTGSRADMLGSLQRCIERMNAIEQRHRQP